MTISKSCVYYNARLRHKKVKTKHNSAGTENLWYKAKKGNALPSASKSKVEKDLLVNSSEEALCC